MALADKPVSAMPRPGPLKISPPSAGCPSATRRNMHQAAILSSTTALATPAPNRNAAQAHGKGNAMASVSSTVAASPQRARRAGCQRWRALGATQGSAMQAKAPSR